MPTTESAPDLPNLPAEDDPRGRLVENVMHFARVLRKAGLPIGPGQVLKSIEAIRAVDITDRDQFYWALHAALINRRDQREIFDQAFHVFWRNPRILDRMMSMVLPDVEAGEPDGRDEEQIRRRLADALSSGEGSVRREEQPEVEVHAEMTWSQEEVLRGMDFESMSVEEMELAKRAMARMRLPIAEQPSRRFRPNPAGRRADLRATMRAQLRSGGDIIPLRRKKRLRRPPPLVILCDISGSMAQYSRMLLHFMHALTNDRDRVHTFLFGTRLTNVTRYLKQKDVDTALERIAEVVEDWSGGTRLGACLNTFNRQWSRRVLGQGAVVILITDGLDRDAAEGLSREMERLHKSCRRLIWLNPLLRYDGFEPRSMGARAMMPHVDEFRSAHNLNSLADLATALSQPLIRRQEGVSEWLKKM